MQESVPSRLRKRVTLFGPQTMGILDDAIREHLELIRRRGTADSEVQRLENEAFGPPTRPDEADFPESEEAHPASGNGVATEAAVEEHGPEEAVAHEDVTTLLPAEGEGESEPESVAVEPEEEGGAAAEVEDREPAAEVEDGEPAAEEHPIVDEAAPEPEEEPSEEAGVPAEEGTSLYDQRRDEELDIDLDLQLEDEPPAAEPPSEEHAVAEPEGTTPLEPPIESLDTVEHPFPEEIAEPEGPPEEIPPSEEDAVPDEAPPPEQVEKRGEEGEEEDEDVLADTPEFLKDAPEDDELWFEQGEPKDFDF
jgi:hypothetical protein